LYLQESAQKKEKNMKESMGRCFLIRHLELLTGLTDRTIRKHISSGLLRGEIIHGLWHFSWAETESFIRHPSVRASILTKQNAAVHDFLLENHRKSCEACMIVDFPGENPKEIAEYFFYSIAQESMQDVFLAFDGAGASTRIILKGDTNKVLQLINGYAKQYAGRQPCS